MFPWRRAKKSKPSYIIVIMFFAAVLFTGMARAESAYEYNSYDKRDPFVPLVGLAAEKGAGSAKEVFSVQDVKLQGIIIGQDGEYVAILNGQMVKAGQSVERLSIISIGKNTVQIKIGDKEHTLKLYE